MGDNFASFLLGIQFGSKVAEVEKDGTGEEGVDLVGYGSFSWIGSRRVTSRNELKLSENGP